MKAKILFAIVAVMMGTQTHAQNFNFQDAGDIQDALGMFGEPNPLLRKQLGTGAGKDISISKMFVWSYDGSDWERGGKLHLINDDSMGRAYRITCSVDSSTGDKFMEDRSRKNIAISGKIKSYSSTSGLIIDPCNARW